MTNGWEIENYLSGENGSLSIDGVQAALLAEEFGTPLFVFSAPRIKHNIERLKKASSSLDCELKVCYAAKANSLMAVLETVREAGSDLEVNSGGELWKALKAGFKGEQIIFNGTSKEVWEIEDAIKAEIYAIQVDSVFELSLIEETARRMSKKARVSLRLVPEIEAKTHSGLQTALLTSKFGMMPAEALEAIEKFKDSEWIELCGVHLHIGSQNPEAETYSDALSSLFGTLLEAHSRHGVRLTHLNLGGGFPVNYLRDTAQAGDFPDKQRGMFSADFEPEVAIIAAWQAVKNAADKAGANELLSGLTLLIEPGRSVIADAGTCLTTVRNQKSRPVPSTGGFDDWLLTDAGFNILLSMETYKWYYHLIAATRTSERSETKYKVAGPLCDGGDVYFDIEGEGRLPEHRLLPAGVRPGELLALLNCGAYSVAQMFQYNGRFLPAAVMTLGDGRYKLIRQRDRFEDLINNDRF